DRVLDALTPGRPWDRTGGRQARRSPLGRPRAVWYKNVVARRDESRLVYSTGGLPAAEKPAPAAPAGPNRIRIRLDRRASNRVVTVIAGLPGSAAEIAGLARSLKLAC